MTIKARIINRLTAALLPRMMKDAEVLIKAITAAQIKEKEELTGRAIKANAECVRRDIASLEERLDRVADALDDLTDTADRRYNELSDRLDCVDLGGFEDVAEDVEQVKDFLEELKGVFTSARLF